VNNCSLAGFMSSAWMVLYERDAANAVLPKRAFCGLRVSIIVGRCSKLTAHCFSVLYYVERRVVVFFLTAVPCIFILSEFFIYQLMHKRIALKILKFTLKQLRHVSV
jgi:hypothetical protein